MKVVKFRFAIWLVLTALACNVPGPASSENVDAPAAEPEVTYVVIVEIPDHSPLIHPSSVLPHQTRRLN